MDLTHTTKEARNMENALFQLAAGDGIWAALYVLLFLYVLWDSRKREYKYQDTIQKNQEVIKDLTEGLKVVGNIEKDVSYIKQELERR